MPYEPLTPSRFRELKSEFCKVPDAQLQAFIDLGSRFVDDSWTEKDYESAWAAITCHLLTLEGHGGSTEAELAKAGGSRVTSLKSGTLSLTFSEQGEASDEFTGWLNQTSCGRFYRVLLQLNRAGPRLLTGWGGTPSGYAKDWPWP